MAVWITAMAVALAQEPILLEPTGPDERQALTNLQIWDAVDGLRSVEAVVFEGATITEVGPLPHDLEAHQIHDLGGATVIPGLMDLHVHLALSPGAHFRPDEDLEAVSRHHLAAYIACGVTTVLDTGIPVDAALMMQRLEGEGPSPQLHFLGPLVSPAGGYVSVVLPEIFEPAHDAEDVREQFAAFDAVKPFGVKATLEEGMLIKVWPTYTDEVAQAVMAEAAARNEGVYAHAMSAAEYRMGLELGVAGFVHPTQSPKRGLVKELAARKLPVISTLSAFDHMLLEFEPERMEHPVFQRVVPDIELEMAADEAIQDTSKDIVVAGMLPDRHGWFAKTARKLLDAPGLVRGRVKRMQRSVAKQHRMGVPIAMGSDSGNWPVFLTEFHGPTSLREVELLSDGGLGPTDALTAATWTPAQVLGIDDEVGRIAPGMRADLVVLPRDPTQDITAIWELTHVVLAGEIDTPDGWMDRASKPAAAPVDEPVDEPVAEPPTEPAEPPAP